LVDAQNVRNTAFIADATLNFNVQKEFQVTVGKMKPPGARVRSITSNTSEGLGSGITINAPITINQQPGQDSEELAAIVAVRLGDAISRANSSKIG
jgi:hypothetical protein